MQKINILNLKWKMNFFRKKIHLMNMSSNFINIEINDINYRNKIIEEYGDYLNFYDLIKQYPIPFDILDYYSSIFDYNTWSLISKTYSPDLWFIEKYKHKLNLKSIYIKSGTKITEEFIENNFHLVSLNDTVNLYSNLSEDFIKKYEDKINFEILQISQILSEEFIKSRIDKINLNHIIMYQTLSEEFIEKYIPDNLYNSVVIYQQVSERFAEKHQAKFNMYYYLRSNYDRVTQDFFEKHVNKLSKYEKNSLHSIITRSLKPTTKMNEDERR